jgi:integral membrane protein (TIGR01906 family)
MTMPNRFAGVARILLIVTIPILLIVTPLFIFVSPSFVRHEYSQRGFPPADRFPPAERQRLSDPILLYLRGRVTVEEMAATRTDAGEIALLPEEVQHLVDVRIVMDGFFVAYRLALLLTALALVALWSAPARAAIPWALRRGVFVCIGLMVFILLFSLMDFDLFFTRFHQMFFSEGTWTFYVEDTLIQLYPLPFWVDAVWKLAVSILAEAAALLLLANVLERSHWVEPATP